MANTVGDSLVGTTINDRYRVLALCAEGGSSKVYLGLYEKLNKPLAIKVYDKDWGAIPRIFGTKF